MRSTRNDLETRKNEVEGVLKFAKYLEDEFIPLEDAKYNILSVKTSIKANIVLMIYNAVESTVTSCLKKIHEQINAECVKYDDLTQEMKKIIALYYGYAIDKASNINLEMDIVLRFVDFVNNSISLNITYDELSKSYQLYSGNLDAKEIRSVLVKYGVVFDEKCTELQTVKRDRNILAHGEKSFEEIGRDLSIQQLQEMINQSFSFLVKMIDAIADYLTNKKYIIHDTQ